MKEQLAKIKADAVSAFQSATDAAGLEAVSLIHI